MTTNTAAHAARLDWCRFFGEVVVILDAAGCPPADNVGAAHLWWSPPEEEGAARFQHAPCATTAAVCVTLAGFGNRAVNLRILSAPDSTPPGSSRAAHYCTPEFTVTSQVSIDWLREHAGDFVAALRSRLGI